MTPSELRVHIEETGQDSFFFDRKSMKFFGDTMRNYGVRRTTVTSNFDAQGTYHAEGTERDVWELYRKRPVKGGNQKSAFFDAVTFKRVHEKI